jgi:hypothetical protein
MTTTIFSFEVSAEPKEKKKIAAVLKALGIENISLKEVTEKEQDLSEIIRKGREEFKRGETIKVTSKNVWEVIN